MYNQYGFNDNKLRRYDARGHMVQFLGFAKIIPLLLFLFACTTPATRYEGAAEYALTPSSALFWQHVTASHHPNWFHLLNGNDEALAWRLRMIDSAHESIDMETFLWKLDSGGMQVLRHLLAAADRGVRVRVLLDDSFTSDNEPQLLAVSAHPHIQLRIYNPYHHRPPSMVGRAVFNIGDFQRVNHRLHNKTLAVDGWAVSVGGRNLASEYFGLDDNFNFRDMEVMAMGESVAAVEKHFDAFWNSGWSFPIAEVSGREAAPEALEALRRQAGDAAISSELELERAWQRLAEDAVPGRAEFYSDLPAHVDPALQDEEPNQLAHFLRLSLASAKDEVLMVSAYLVPTEELLGTVRAALARGVRVRVLTNSLSSNNHISAQAAYHHYIKQLVAEGVELYELRADAADRNLYMEDPVSHKRLGLHAKFILLDNDRVFIGSSNLDPRSLKLNTEVGMMVHSDALNQRLRDAIEVDFLPRNSWRVELLDGRLAWVSGEEMHRAPPADSMFQRLEGWFFGLMPIDSQM